MHYRFSIYPIDFSSPNCGENSMWCGFYSCIYFASMSKQPKFCYVCKTQPVSMTCMNCHCLSAFLSCPFTYCNWGLIFRWLQPTSGPTTLKSHIISYTMLQIRYICLGIWLLQRCTKNTVYSWGNITLMLIYVASEHINMSWRKCKYHSEIEVRRFGVSYLMIESPELLTFCGELWHWWDVRYAK